RHVREGQTDGRAAEVNNNNSFWSFLDYVEDIYHHHHLLVAPFAFLQIFNPNLLVFIVTRTSHTPLLAFTYLVLHNNK
ncbi:unnamed protein product, partial [Ascophyllum nodosum]